MNDWELFWNSLKTEQRELFRLLQTTHRVLSENVQMFSYDWIQSKNHIEVYVKNNFGVDLNNLPSNKGI